MLKNPHIISIAPMMAYTDRHFRYLLRLISKHTVLYTEMVTANAVIHGDQDYLLGFSNEEHPVVLQLGGSDPILLSQAAKIAQQYGYDEINLNVGCPSDRVQSGCFGAVLMKQPDLVAECVKAMRDAVLIPVTVKTRLGVDDCDSDELLHAFIGKIREAGCNTVVMHARKAWLSGLSPKENRDVPPLQYDRVYQLKKHFPDLQIIINGGVKTIADVQMHLEKIDGVMLGRIICDDPYFLSTIDSLFYGEKCALKSREEIVEEYRQYIQEQHAKGVALRNMTRHLLNLYRGQPNGRAWRRMLSETPEKNLNKTQPN